MFPLNLQKNIVQLDKQISLLENQYKNMEIEKKRRGQKLEPIPSSCSRNSNARISGPTVRVNVKKNDTSKKYRKPTPPATTRVQTTTSLTSRCGRNCSASGDTVLERKGKSCGLIAKVPVCSCPTLENPECRLTTETKYKKCLCCNNVDTGNKFVDLEKKDHVLRFPNAGGTIEVTVTQKPNENQNSATCHSPLRKSINSERNDIEVCKCHKGQKWSEILSVDSYRNQQSNSGSFIKNKITSVEGKKVSPQQNLNNNKQPEINISQNEDSGIKEETFEIPVKLPTQFNKIKKQSEINSNKFEKEVQCSLEKSSQDLPNELKDPAKIFQVLVKQFQHLQVDNQKSSSNNTTCYMKIKDTPTKGDFTANKLNISSDNFATNPNVLKHQCEVLVKEKLLLTKDLEAKEAAIATMKQREEEYLSLINTMKAKLEKAKSNTQEGAETVKEMTVLKDKFSEQVKVSKSLKKRLFLVQRGLEQYALENDTLKTQIKILKLEAQKHTVLLAGKDAEIKKYREEIQNFQRHISEHLSALKSSSQAVDVEKMMEVIMHQTQIFAQTDLESLEKEGKDSTKGQNVLMHSSPTSTKTSNVNSSWRQISSIYDHDESKAESDVIFLNGDGNEKNYFDVFGGNLDSERPEGTKQPESPQEKDDVKYSSSFTSCESVREDEHRSTSNRDSVLSRETTINENDVAEEQLRESSLVPLDKAQSNIDELLKVMKLKFSKEIFNKSFNSYNTGDYLDMSQISSISPL